MRPGALSSRNRPIGGGARRGGGPAGTRAEQQQNLLAIVLGNLELVQERLEDRDDLVDLVGGNTGDAHRVLAHRNRAADDRSDDLAQLVGG